MFQIWYEKYERMIYSLLHKFSIKYDFDEFYQLALIRLWQIQKDYDPAKSPNTDQYVYLKLKFFIIDEIRRRIKHQERFVPADHEMLIPLIETADNTYFELYINNLDACLTGDERTWFQYALAGFKLSEIAEFMDKSPSTIKKIRTRAREKICKNNDFTFKSGT